MRRCVVHQLLAQVAIESILTPLWHAHLQEHLLLSQVLLLGRGLGRVEICLVHSRHVGVLPNLVLIQLASLNFLHQHYLVLFV